MSLDAMMKEAMFPSGKCNCQTSREAPDGKLVGLQCKLDEGHEGKHWCGPATYGWYGSGIARHPDGFVEMPEQFWDESDDAGLEAAIAGLCFGSDR